MGFLKKLKTSFNSNFSFTPQERNLLVYIVLAMCTGYILHVLSNDNGISDNAGIFSSRYSNPHSSEERSSAEQLSDSLSSLYINRITEEELLEIKLIGEKTAQSIIEFRMKNGPLTSCEDLLAVPGIGEKRLNNIREFIAKKTHK